MLKGIEFERVTWERAEARVLARHYKSPAQLAGQLRSAELVYGNGSAERIRALMREIWVKELLK